MTAKASIATTTGTPLPYGRTNRPDGDFYPTPAWATLALLDHVVDIPSGTTVLEPAAGLGHMVRALEGRGLAVTAEDIATGKDFLERRHCDEEWIITNPPFSIAGEFVTHALELSPRVAMFVRFTFLESQKRFNSIFSTRPPTTVGLFTSRVSLAPDRIIETGGNAIAYVWAVWEPPLGSSALKWIPPSAKQVNR